MGKNDILINVLLDRSGSMGGLETDVIGHYNQYIKDQREQPGKATVSLVLFDDRYEEVYIGRDINEVPELTKDTYYTRGSTAYLDAIGRLILAVDGIKNKPKKVVFIVNTDGLENSSQEFTFNKIKEMVTERHNNHDWQFVFVGAGLDKTQMERTISASGFGSYAVASATPAGMSSTYSHVTRTTSDYRSGNSISLDMGNVNTEEEDIKKKAKVKTTPKSSNTGR